MFKIANVGSIDRVVRLIAGGALIALPFITQMSLWENPAFRFGLPIVGAVLLITALVSSCPIYQLTGLSTRKSA